ncbi:MAG: hypothetical protein MJE77_29790 [Proteobacteria bacterium]|nr:hypothetical protein [Pseudomonadota bacterium]
MKRDNSRLFDRSNNQPPGRSARNEHRCALTAGASGRPDMSAPWKPIPPDELGAIMRGAEFSWGLSGGYAIERFVREPFREHG